MESERMVRLLRRMALKNVPVKMRLELTRRCNLRCIHCKVVCEPEPQNELSAAEIGELLPQLRKAGVFQLNLTGGEIFSRPDIIEVLETIFSFDFLINIQTNATLIATEHIELLKRNIDKIVRAGVSVYGGNAEVHEAITGVPGSFQKAIDTILALIDNGIETAAFCLLMAENAAHHKETHEFLESKNILHQFSALMIAREDGCMDPLDHRVDDTLLPDLPVRWYDYLNPDPLTVPDHYPPETPITEWCIAGRMPNILPNGDVVPCSVIRIPVGNIREHSFEYIYNNSPLFNELRALTVADLDCKDCEHFPRCKPCIGLSYYETGSYTTRPTEYCRLTKHLINKKGERWKRPE
jgi:radical SAM protein with 4Fe4S-binding SPASM domain